MMVFFLNIYIYQFEESDAILFETMIGNQDRKLENITRIKIFHIYLDLFTIILNL